MVTVESEALAAGLSPKQLTGRQETHLVDLAAGQRLQAAAASAFLALQADARSAGFELVIASSFRSFGRQLAIWNGKASGSRNVYDDAGCEVAMAALPPVDQLRAILRYSAIPGTSRHHWGTDLDVYDAAAVSADYKLQLAPQEVAVGGVFDPLHCWLDQRMEAGESHGFYRPYAQDRGGIAPERWHLSYAPLAVPCAQLLTESLLIGCWDECSAAGEAVLLTAEIRAQLPDIMANYVSVAETWCPAHYRR
mgnify:CR=1 FL=1